MDFQKLADSFSTAASIVSVEKLENGSCGEIRIVTGNSPYIDTIERPTGMRMLTDKFVPNSLYTTYMPRDLNFEDSCFNAAVNKKLLHSYANPARFNIWFNMSFIPIDYEDGNLCYCIYMVEVNFKADAKRLSNISADIASSVLETCIKLRSPDDFRVVMKDICEDIRDMCGSEHCCVLLMDSAERKCSVLCEAFSKDTKLLPMSNYLDDSFFGIAESWKDTIAGSNCLIVKNDHDMEVVRERNPVWHESLTSAGGKTIVLFPLEFKDELLGYIWAINFNYEAADTIKETLELTTFILASELYSYKLMDKLHILSSKDMLTGVMNRNEMNNYVDELSVDTSKDSIGILFADLNGLKVINDSEGHTAGDNLLKSAADALTEVFSVRDIFRAGGDEFVVILTNITEDDLAVKEKKLREVSVKYDRLSFAIGTAFIKDGSGLHSALRLADERMYADKNRYYQEHPEKKRRTSAT